MANLLVKRSSAMEKEIHQQPMVVGKILKTYIDENNNITIDVPVETQKVVLVASGSSYHSARYGSDLFGKVADMDARAMYSSEFLLKPKVPSDEGTLYVFITQSGETSDTLRAAKRAQQLGMKVLSITNKDKSSIGEISDYVINTFAGAEKSIAATKSFTAQTLCLFLLVMKFAQIRNIDVQKSVENIKQLPDALNETFGFEKKIKQLAGILKKQKCFVVTADGLSYSLAKEMALKVKETSYMNVSAMILGEFMHGHVAVLNNNIPLVYLSASGISYGSAKYLEKIKSDYNPSIYVIGPSHERITPNFNIALDNDDVDIRMFSNILIVQLLALEIAKKFGRDIDKPKGLSKVVKEV